MLLTVPILDYLNKASRDWDCSYPVSLFGQTAEGKTRTYIPTVNGKSAPMPATAGRPTGNRCRRSREEQILRTHPPQHARSSSRRGCDHLGQTGSARPPTAAWRRSSSTTSRAVGATPTATSTRAPPGTTSWSSRSLAYAAAVKGVDPIGNRCWGRATS